MVWHTTETDEVPAYRPNSAPHFTIPDDEPALYQHVNLGRIGNALRHSQPPETNAICLIQVEQVARSSLAPWVPKNKEQQGLIASLAEFAKREFDVPKRRVFEDTLEPGVVWATSNNPRRRSGTWGKAAGHYTHCEVTGGNDHWDCGSEQLQTIFDGQVGPQLVSAWQIMAAWQEDESHRRTRALTPHCPDLEKLLRLAGRDDETIARIKRHEKRRHRVMLGERLVDVEKADDWKEWRDEIHGG
jgi:hypothetical protein